MKYFKGESVPNLDSNLIILAEDSKAKATQLFTENIDLNCFTSDDYKRLKNFLTPWYASLRSFPSTMRHASDVRSLPDSHLNELINSFGFVDSLDEISKVNKVDFFYDLVNLYKIKGTPEAVERVLGYFGISDVELMEYWLQYDNQNELIFRPVKISSATNPITNTYRDIDFDTIVNTDPHWYLTKDNINQLFLNNRIAFPSKSPYFGLRPTVQLVGDLTTPSLSILTRIILNQYDDYLAGNYPVKNLILTNIKIYASILDLYLGVIYAFNKLFPKTFNPSALETIIYNGSMSLSNDDIFELYSTLNGRASNLTRDQIEINRVLMGNNFSRDRNTNFLTNLNTAETNLNILNPDLKLTIDTSFSSGSGLLQLKQLVKDLSSWIKQNINIYTPDLSVLLFGFSSLEYVTDIINFFKPYRARLISLEHAFYINSPLNDSIITEDNLSLIKETDTFIDWDVADSIPGFEEGFETTGITSTPPNISSKRITNIYIDNTLTVKCTYDDSTSYTGITNFIYSNPSIGQYRITNLYLSISNNGESKIFIEYNNIAETTGNISTKIPSIPPLLNYSIIDVYLNDNNIFEMIYDTESIINPNEKIYFTRNTYDNGSYFDIGASCDDPPTKASLFIEDRIDEIYNSHIGIGINNLEYTLDSTTNDVIYVLTDGGWSLFDSGALFDQPAISDICEIEVYNVLYGIRNTSDDGTFDNISLDDINIRIGREVT